MITNRASEIAVSNALRGDRVQMSIDPSSFAKIMSILTNLYEDPITAVIREYSTNARDATIEAGVDKPIEVKLPNRLERVLTIRDWGVDLSVDDIHEVYSQYGKSTKESTNAQTGHLGLGCKSALTYCDQFTVTSTKNGVRVVVAVSRDDDNGGSMTVVDTSTTDEPSGTVVSVPVREYDVAHFDRKARNLFRFWDEGSVLLNGQPVRRIEGLKLSDHMVMTTELDESIIVMGGVPYPVKREDIALGLSHGNNIVVWVPIGTIDHAPSREGVMMTRQTKDSLIAIRELFDELLVKSVQSAIDAAPTHMEALKVLLNWKDRVPSRLKSDGYTYKRQQIPLRMERPADPDEPFFVVRANSSRLKDRDKVESYGAQAWEHTYWIHGFDKTDWTPAMRKKLNHYMEEELGVYLYSQRFLFTNKKLVSPYIEDDRRIDFAVIDAVKLPRKVGSRAGASGRIPGSYDFIEDGMTNSWGVPGDDIDTSRPLFYCIGKLGEYTVARFAKFFEDEYPNYILVPLRSNRVNKFKRLFPEAKAAREGVREAWERLEKTITDEHRLIAAWNNAKWASDVREIDPNRVDDPDIKQAHVMLKRYAEIQPIQEKIAKILDTETYLGVQPLEGDFAKHIPKNPIQKYLLFYTSRYYDQGFPRKPDDREHAYVYMNAFYKTLDKSNTTD